MTRYWAPNQLKKRDGVEPLLLYSIATSLALNIEATMLVGAVPMR